MPSVAWFALCCGGARATTEVVAAAPPAAAVAADAPEPTPVTNEQPTPAVSSPPLVARTITLLEPRESVATGDSRQVPPPLPPLPEEVILRAREGRERAKEQRRLAAERSGSWVAAEQHGVAAHQSSTRRSLPPSPQRGSSDTDDEDRDARAPAQEGLSSRERAQAFERERARAFERTRATEREVEAAMEVRKRSGFGTGGAPKAVLAAGGDRQQQQQQQQRHPEPLSPALLALAGASGALNPRVLDVLRGNKPSFV